MTVKEEFQYVRPVDFAAIEAAGPTVRVTLPLLMPENGADKCSLRYIRTPAGGGSPEGLHTHTVDQIYYLISGTMLIEIDGKESTVNPGSVIFFPAGTPHRNWNEEETVHLSILAPIPEVAN